MRFCTYCEMPAKRYEMDHFPVTRCVGGTEIVPVCFTCHDLKDRTPLDEWPKAFSTKAFFGAPLDSLLRLLAAVRGRALRPEDLLDVLGEWATLPPPSRLLLAKMVRVVIE
jgi:hypothetical protein